jgi:hypothetical protein
LWHKPYLWLSSAAIVELAFGGLLFFGFLLWFARVVFPVMEDSSIMSDFVTPLSYAIPQFIASIVSIVGGVLLFKRIKNGIFVSIASLPELLYSNTWLESFSAPFFQLASNSPVMQPLAYTVFFGSYNICIVVIAALLIVGWKVTKL